MKKILILYLIILSSISLGLSFNQSTADNISLEKTLSTVEESDITHCETSELKTCRIEARLGCGRQLLAPKYVSLNDDSGSTGYYLMLNAYIPIEANETYCLYISPALMQFASNAKLIRTTLFWKDMLAGEVTEEENDIAHGGWGGYMYITNNSSSKRYFSISDIDIKIPLDQIPQKPDGLFMLQREKDENTMTFEGYYSYMKEENVIDDGYVLANEERCFYTYVGSNLEEDDILKLFKAYDNGFNVTLSIEDNKYAERQQDVEGNYPVTIVATDENGNVTKYPFEIRVIEAPVPTISGDNDIYFYLSKHDAITVENILAQFTSSYCGQAGTLELTEESLEAFYKAAGTHSTTSLTIKATFSGGRSVTKTFNLHIVDDVAPTIYVTEFTITTSTADELSELELVNKIEEAYKEIYDKDPNEIVVLSNSYLGHEEDAGIYYITYKCVVNDEEEMGRLKLVVKQTEQSSSNMPLYITLASSATLLIIVLGGMVVLYRRKH